MYLFSLLNTLFTVTVLFTVAAFAAAAADTPKPTANTTASKPAPTTLAPTLTTKTLGACPTDDELKNVGCLCYTEPMYLVCNGSSNTLTFNNRYAFQTLVIRNSPNLPFWSEHITGDDDFTVESLVILQSNADVVVTDNFNDLLRLPSKAIKIVTSGQIKMLDISHMRKTLTSISVSGVPKLVHGYFAFGEETTLTHLQFRSVAFEPVLEDLFLSGLPLSVLEISNSNLKGIVSFVPTKCPPEDERIVIDLRGNPELTELNFGNLFKATKANPSLCHFHIDLSYNSGLDVDILNKNVAVLEAHGKNMFIHLAGVQLNCSCDFIKLYKDKLNNNIHSVTCKDHGFLDELVANTVELKKVCPNLVK